MKKHTNTRFISYLLSIILFTSSFSGFVLQSSAEVLTSTINWYFDASNGHLKIEGSGAIPDYANSDSVPWNQHRTEISSIEITSGITHIGKFAFYACQNATSLSIADTVTTIGASAFAFCESLSRINLSSNISEIGLGAFTNTPSLLEINVDEANPYFTSSNGVLFNKNLTRLIAYPAAKPEITYTIPDSVTVLESFSFFGCKNIVHMYIPAKITNIKDYALAYTSNLAFIYYMSAQEIWNSITYGSNWNLGIAADVAGGSCTVYYMGVVEDSYSGVCGDNIVWTLDTTKNTLTLSGSGDMYNYDNESAPWSIYRNYIVVVNISEKITSIGNYAFRGCYSLISCSVNNSLKRIGKGAFYECIYLTMLLIPNSLEVIESYAFYYCIRFNSPYLPSGITTIEDYTFYCCKSFDTVSLPSTVTNIGNYAFANCDALGKIYYSGSSYDWNKVKKGTGWDYNTGASTTYKKYELICTKELTTSGQCGNNLTWSFNTSSGELSISGTGEMYNFSLINVPWDDLSDAITSVKLSDGITSIGTYAFYGLDALRKITIPQSVTKIGSWSFAYSSQLTEVVLPSGLTSITDYVFIGCPALSVMNLPEGLTSLGKYAVAGTAFTTINLPQSLQTISSNAFDDCDKLTTISIPESVTKIDEYAFRSCDVLESVYFEKTLTSIGKRAFSDCCNLANIYFSGTETLWNSIAKDEEWDYNAGTSTENQCYTVVFLNTPDFSGECGENFSWKIWKESYRMEITGTGAMPDWADGESTPWVSYSAYIKNVDINGDFTTIGNNTFKNLSSLKEINVPESVTAIGNYAFSNCRSLNEITIPKNVTTIGSYSFAYCTSLSDINLPEKLESIDSFAFYNCTKFKTINLPQNLITLKRNAFSICSSLTSVTLPLSLQVIEPSVFSYCSALTDVYYEGNNSDWYKVEKRYWKETAKTITVHYTKELATSGSLNENINWEYSSEEKLLKISGTGNMPSYTDSFETVWYPFKDSIENVEITEGITTIGSYSLADFSVLTTITIPKSITSIGQYVFCNDSMLTDIYFLGNDYEWGKISKNSQWDAKTGKYTLHYLGEKYVAGNINSSVSWIYWNDRKQLEILGSGSMGRLLSEASVPWYSYVSEIQTVNISADITYIFDYAFYNCINLADIYFLGNNHQWKNIGTASEWITLAGSATTNKTYTVHFAEELPYTGTCGDNLTWELWESTKTLTIKGTGPMYDWTSYSDVPWYSYKTYIENVDIPNGVTNIGNYAFRSCKYLTSIILSDGLTTIGEYAFSNCTSLASITLPDNLTTIEKYAFYQCSALTEVTLPDSLTTIGEYAFHECISLTSITLPDSLTTIGRNAFSNCSALTSAKWTKGATYIPSYAFQNCSALTNITIPEGVTTINDLAFNGCTSLKNIDLPESLTTLSYGSFQACTSLTSITLPDNVVTTGSNIFKDCISLTEIILGEGITKIGDYTFHYCTALQTVYVPVSLKEIGICAFSGCYYLADIYYPGNEAKWKAIKKGNLWNNDTGSKTEKRTYTVNYGEENYYTGSCGTGYSTNWTYWEERKVLEISGTGPMPGWNSSSKTPWYKYLSNIERIDVLQGVTSIGDYAFYGASALKKVNLPDSISNIGSYAFYNCKSLTDISVPLDLKEIGKYAFYSCSALKYAPLSLSQQKLTTIADYAFNGCSSLTYLPLPESLNVAMKNAFSGCTKIQEVSIPKSMTSYIGIDAFLNCTALKTVYYSGTESYWNRLNIYSGNDKLKNATRIYGENYIMLSNDRVSAAIKAGTTASLALASFSGNKLIDVKVVELTKSTGMELGENGAGLSYVPGNTVKAFLWTDDTVIAPLCDMKSLLIK